MFLRQCKTHNHKLLTPTKIFHIGRNLYFDCQCLESRWYDNTKERLANTEHTLGQETECNEEP
jgi:hypothetical protein